MAEPDAIFLSPDSVALVTDDQDISRLTSTATLQPKL